MTKDWRRIREARTDITDYVIHWVRARVVDGKWKKSLDTLIDIIECGYLKPGFSVMRSIYGGSPRPTVKGPYPAVCFTEQTLDNFIISCKVSSRYAPYGIGFHKWALYQYGGRPVIYGTEDILGTKTTSNEPGYEEGKEVYIDGLPRDSQYLWVRYDPIPNEHGYVIDWTHEREWRCRVNTYHDHKLGDTPTEGIPLLLPGVYDYEKENWIYYLPKILVHKSEEKETVETIIRELLPQWSKTCENKYLQKYFTVLPKARVIALDDLPTDEGVKLDWVLL